LRTLYLGGHFFNHKKTPLFTLTTINTSSFSHTDHDQYTFPQACEAQKTMDTADSPPEAKRAKPDVPGSQENLLLSSILGVARGMMKGNYRPGCSFSQTEDCRFRELFGCGPLEAASAWRKMEAHSCLVIGGGIHHMLWGLLLMKQYATEQVLCKIAGDVDAKTFRKWAWLFISALAHLEAEVVSFQLCPFVFVIS
jgi:hypothetical protein